MVILRSMVTPSPGVYFPGFFLVECTACFGTPRRAASQGEPVSRSRQHENDCIFSGGSSVAGHGELFLTGSGRALQHCPAFPLPGNQRVLTAVPSASAVSSRPALRKMVGVAEFTPIYSRTSTAVVKVGGFHRFFPSCQILQRYRPKRHTPGRYPSVMVMGCSCFVSALCSSDSARRKKNASNE